jgi:hypothetical protein
MEGRFRFALIGVELVAAVSISGQEKPREAMAFPATRKVVVYKSDAAAQAAAAKMNVLKTIEYGDRRILVVSDQAERALSSTEQKRVSYRDDLNQIRLRSAVIDTTRPAPRVAAALEAAPSETPQLYLIQFAGPVKEGWLADVLAAGNVRIVSYVPTNAYLVWADGPAVRKLHGVVSERTSLQYVGPFHPAYKLHPRLTLGAPSLAGKLPGSEAGSGEVTVTVQLVSHQGSEDSVRAIQQKAKKVLREPWVVGPYRNLRIVVAESELVEIGKRPDVVNVEPWLQPRTRGEIQGQVVANQLNAAGSQPTGPGYMAWLTSLGFTSDFGFAVDVTDSGFDRGQIAAGSIHADFLNAGLASRVVYVQRVTGTTISTTAVDNLDTDGHGTINAAIIGGLNTTADTRPGTDFEDAAGFQYGLGIAPFVQIGASTILPGGTWTNPDFTELINSAYRNGARISSNSWGSSCSGGCCPLEVLGAYDATSQEYDGLVRDARPAAALDGGAPGNQEMLIVFAAGNQGGCPNEDLGNNGSTAKNTLVVGAGENANQAGTDGCGIANAGANDVRDIINFSSRGATIDGRIKPDIMAPGTHVFGAASQDPGFDGDGVCGAAANNPGDGVSSAADYFPAGQTLYTWSSGTSHATPAVAGGAALVRQWFINKGRPAPSPAMVKATLMNAATWMTGTGANDTLPSNNQGMGRMNLAQTFDDTPRLLIDQTRTFDGAGETFVITGSIANSTRPFRVALAWTDAPGSTVGNAWVNDLDLEVSIDDGTSTTLYRGNNFLNAVSQSGGAADTRNNVESVWLPAGTTGDFTVTVRASNVPGDGVPGFGDATDQDFALEVYNGELAARTPVDVVLVLDTSGSMSSVAAGGTRPKIEVLRDAVELFVKTWIPFSVPADRIGVVYFDSAVATFPAAVLQPFTGNEQAVIDAVRAEPASGWTALGGGLQIALNALGTSTNRRFVILFTNGMQNFSPMVTSLGGGAHEIRAAATGSVVDGVTVQGDSGVSGSAGTTLGDFGITIHSIGTGVSGAQWQDLIEDISTQTGGDHHFTSEPDADLQQFFLEDLVTSLRGTTMELVAYRRGALSPAGAEERFTLNAGASRATFLLSWDGVRRKDALQFTLHKGTSAVPGVVTPTRGDFYTLLTLDFPLDVHGTRIDAAGEWLMRIRGNDVQSVGYQAAALVDDGRLKYDFHLVRDDYGVGASIPLRAQVSDGGIPVTGLTEAKVIVSAPPGGLGTFLSENAVSKADMEKDYGVDADNFSTRVAKKEFVLMRDDALRKKRQPSSVTLSLFDDGTVEHGDQTAGDGVYSNLFTGTRAPGHYNFDFRLSGTAPASGAFSRQQSMGTTVRLKGVDSSRTLIRFQRDSAGDFMLVTPVDSFGNYLGPGYGHLIRMSLDKGELIGDLVDNLDGSYRQGIRVDWNAAGSASLVILDSAIQRPVEVTNGFAWWWWLIAVLILLVAVWVWRKLS